MKYVRPSVEVLPDLTLLSVSIVNPGTLHNYDGDAVDVQIQYTNTGSSPFFSLSNAPSGISVDASTGEISGLIASWAHNQSPWTATVNLMDMGTMESASEQYTWDVNQQDMRSATVTPGCFRPA